MKKCRYYKIVRQGFFLGQTVTAAQVCLEKECAERLLQHVAGNNVNFYVIQWACPAPSYLHNLFTPCHTTYFTKLRFQAFYPKNTYCEGLDGGIQMSVVS